MRKFLTNEEVEHLTKEFNLLISIPNAYINDRVHERITEIHRDLTHSRIANVKLTLIKGGKD